MNRWGWLVCCGLIVTGRVQANDLEQVVTLLEFVLDVDATTAGSCLDQVLVRAEAGELSAEQVAGLRKRLAARLDPAWNSNQPTPLSEPSLRLAVLWGDSRAAVVAQQRVVDRQRPPEQRAKLLRALGRSSPTGLLPVLQQILNQPGLEPAVRGEALECLTRLEDPQAVRLALRMYPQLSQDEQAQLITTLTQRGTGSRELIAAVRRGEIPAAVVGANHLRTLAATRDPQLAAEVQRLWGTIRQDRNPAREEVIRQLKRQMAAATGDPHRGQAVFHKVCGQCHRIHGTGQEVGPDLTSNGRSNFDQLLSNVLDPSLVIGPAYQALTVVTTDGRILTGLAVEQSPQRVVLKTQGGKVETIPGDQVDELAPSRLSLMPENLEQQLAPQELWDLFSFLVLDKPPADQEARLIPGAPSFAPSSR